MSEDELWPLPGGWQWTSFQSVAEVSSDLRDPTATPEAIHIAPNHIESGSGRLLGRGTVNGDGVTSPKHAFHPGQVLYSKIRPYLAKAVLVDFEGLCSADMYPISVRAGLMEPRYLHRWLVSPAFTAKASESQGRTVLPKINQEALYRKPVPLAPLPEQKRIADKLDALLARVEACRERLERIPGILKRFRQSVLAAATSGELTREWREARGGDGEWPVVDLESVASDFSYGSAAKSSKVGKVPVLRMGNIQDGLLDWGDLVFTSDAAEISKYKLVSGDVLFNRTNSPELVGKTAVFRGETDAIYAGYLIRVRCSERLLPDYLNYCLGSPAGREYCRQVKSDGVSQSNINARKLAAFTFGLPSVEEQQEIIRRVEELLALNVTLGTKSRCARVLVDRLTPSTLAKAFRGKLVPQDTNDEPTAELLAKLKAAQSNAAAEPPYRRPKTAGNRPTMSNTDKDTIKSAILKLKAERFSFDELRAQVSGDYESLKAALFELLEEPSPVVRQVFDKRGKAMHIVRVRP
ncbi:restriction endonuclease subunit S [Corallococcus sp. AS-1-12]|uniref:restriction endonuclease subunit S n=1 Tax=Corallococcus TaxID=83461 RepID=UPI00351CBD6F|nr:restriction endonuclease subunit S [Corallococcus sp. AS-1-12]